MPVKRKLNKKRTKMPRNVKINSKSSKRASQKKRGRKVRKMQNGSADPTKELLEELKKDKTLKKRIIDYLILLKENSSVSFKTIKQGHKFTKPGDISQIKDILFSKDLETFLDGSLELPVTTLPDSSYFKCKYLGGKYETLNETNNKLEHHITKWLNNIIRGTNINGTQNRNCNTKVIPDPKDKILFTSHDLYTLVRFYEMVRYQAKEFLIQQYHNHTNLYWKTDFFFEQFIKYVINNEEIITFLKDNKNVLEKFLPHFTSDLSVDEKKEKLMMLYNEIDMNKAIERFKPTHIAIEWKIAHDIMHIARCFRNHREYKKPTMCYKEFDPVDFFTKLKDWAKFMYPSASTERIDPKNVSAPQNVNVDEYGNLSI